jgi:hypothetical protein
VEDAEEIVILFLMRMLFLQERGGKREEQKRKQIPNRKCAYIVIINRQFLIRQDISEHRSSDIWIQRLRLPSKKEIKKV